MHFRSRKKSTAMGKEFVIAGKSKLINDFTDILLWKKCRQINYLVISVV